MGKKSGETTTVQNNYDPVTSKKMADIAERQQEMAEDQWQMYKDYFKDYEIAAAQGNKELLPYQVEASKKFFDETKKGLDVNERMALAETDVKHAFKLGESNRRREASRYGIDPGSTAFANASNSAALDEARTIAGARTLARLGAEEINYNRVALGAGKNPGNADPYTRAAGSYSGAASTYAPLATRVLSSTQNRSVGGWDQFYSMLGNAGGQAAGTYTAAKMAAGG